MALKEPEPDKIYTGEMKKKNLFVCLVCVAAGIRINPTMSFGSVMSKFSADKELNLTLWIFQTHVFKREKVRFAVETLKIVCSDFAGWELLQ